MEFENKTIHFIGISGVGMIALAQYLRSYARCKVSGSDLNITSNAKELENQGVKIYNGHDISHVKNAHIIVYSSAIPESNCELTYAKKQKLPTYLRGEFLGRLMSTYERRIAIAGTHGKTTSTGLMVHVLDSAGITPSFMVGGELPPYYINGRFSESSTFVAESDESDGTFLNISPNFAIITNVEPEHMNFYKTTENLIQHFIKFCEIIMSENGKILINNDNEILRSIASELPQKHIITYGIKNDADFKASHIKYTQKGIAYSLLYKGVTIGAIQTHLFGTHNVLNSCAVGALSQEMGISLSHFQQGCASFQGVKRRMQLIGDIDGALIYDDYGHHPTEIKTTLEGLKKSLKRPVTCIFQPHRYSRTHELLDDFAKSFNHADNTIVTDIFSANESNTSEICSSQLVEKIKLYTKKPVQYIKTSKEIIRTIKKSIKQDDIIITMGAGNIHLLSKELATQLNKTKR